MNEAKAVEGVTAGEDKVVNTRAKTGQNKYICKTTQGHKTRFTLFIGTPLFSSASKRFRRGSELSSMRHLCSS